MGVQTCALPIWSRGFVVSTILPIYFDLAANRTVPMKPIRKAVFPVAGLGTRFLPATKAIPKEMLPVVDRPLIQYAVDEAREARSVGKESVSTCRSRWTT